MCFSINYAVEEKVPFLMWGVSLTMKLSFRLEKKPTYISLPLVLLRVVSFCPSF